MEVMVGTPQRQWKPVKCEIKNPNVDWTRSWDLAKMKHLTSEQSSFLFKLLHNILPTNSRLHHLKQKDNPACSHCSSGFADDCQHALLNCSKNEDVNIWVISFTRKVVPNCSLLDIVTLNLDINEDMKYPLVWALSHVFSLIWHLRMNKKSVSLFNIRADMEARINFLRTTRVSGLADKLENLLNL